jgi:hypothetical protein
MAIAKDKPKRMEPQDKPMSNKICPWSSQCRVPFICTYAVKKAGDGYSRFKKCPNCFKGKFVREKRKEDV